MAEHDLHEFVGAIVAQIVRDDLVATHVLGLAVVERGDDVPGRAPVRHQIESGEQARDMERLVVAGGIGGAEPEPLGRHAHHREHGRPHRASRNGCRAAPCARGCARTCPAWTGDRRRSRGGISPPPGRGRCGGSSRRDQVSVRESGWRQELTRLVQFWACRKAINVIWRMRRILSSPCSGEARSMRLAAMRSSGTHARLSATVGFMDSRHSTTELG